MFHVYVEGPVDRTPEGIQRLAVAISAKYGLPVPDLVKRMTAGRFRVKANIDAATADAYARALEEVGARVKVEEAHPTQPSMPIVPPEPAPPPKSGPIPAAARTAPPPEEAPRTKAPTASGEKPSRGGYYSVSPATRSKTPSSAPSDEPAPRSKTPSAAPPRSKTPSAAPSAAPPRAKTPSSGPGAPSSTGAPREAHPKSQLMPPSRAPAPSVPPPTTPAASAFDELSLPTGRSGSPSAPPATDRSASSPTPATGAARPASPLPPASERPGAYSSNPASASRPASSSVAPATDRSASSPTPATGAARPASSSLPPATERAGSYSSNPASASRPASSSVPPATPPATASRPASSSLPPPTNASRPASSSLPPPNTPRPASSSLPPANDRSGSTSVPPGNAPRATNQPYQSGLSAAYSQQIPVSSDLGALGNSAFSLSSLDGNDASAGPEGSFGPPASPPPEPASPVKFAPKTASGPVAKPAAAKEAALDLFAPPDAAEQEQVVNLAVEAPAPASKKRSNQPTTQPLGRALTPAKGKPKISQGAAMGGVAVPDMPRSRFAAGILLAIVLGFIPAHLIASKRESSAFTKIDEQIVATQSAADTPEMYAALDSFRDAQLKNKESEHRSIALQSLLIWAVIAAGLGYIWFRRIPWDRTPDA